MSKFRKGLMKRVMAVILSGAMVMSNMSAYAAEIGSDATDGYVEAASEVGETEAEETASKETEKADDEGAAETTTNAASEAETTASTEKETEAETTVSTETAAPTETETTETKTSAEETASTEDSTEKESLEGTSTEAGSETEEITETETESTEEETTEVSEDNAEAGITNFEITEALIKNQEYGDEILKFTVLVDMPLKTAKTPIVVGENSYTKYVAAENDNPVDKKGDGVKDGRDLIPVSGAAFKIQPLKDAKITFVIAGAGEPNKAKYYYFVEDDGGTGKKVATSAPASSFESGAYSCDLEAGKTYYFFVNGSKVNVYNIGWKDKNANRPAWADVQPPVITAALNEENKEIINVTVDAAIGDDADKLTVYMYDKKGEEVDKQESVKEQNQTIFEFEPDVTGEYTFKAEITREGELTPIASELTAPITCEVSQKLKWEFKSYGNGMGDKDTVDDKNMPESVQVASSNGKGKIVPNSNDGLSFYYTTLNPNTMNFTFSVNAHVDKWKYTNGQEGFGIMVSDSVGDIKATDDPIKSSARFWNNSYQAVISKISYKWNSAGVAEDNTGESITMQIGVGATEKIGVTPEDVQAIIVDNVAQQPARYKAEQYPIDTTYAKYGEGQYNMVANWENDDAPIGSDKEVYEDFWLQLEKNNTGYAVSYAKYEMNEDGSYKLDENGKKIVDASSMSTKQYYDPDVLSVLEKNKIYIGMFAARNATITFSDIKLETRPMAEDDTPRIPKPAKYINLSTSILSGSVTNTETYSFMFASNWRGKFRLKDSNGNYIARTDEQGNVMLDEQGNPINTWDVNGTLDPDVQYCQDGDNAKDTKVRVELRDLSVGKNDFVVEYTPDQTWSPEFDKYTPDRKVIELKSYNMVEVPFSVEYKKYGQEGQIIYVSQDGKSTNIGTKENPLDIYTAVKYAQPGQTILLNGGRYSLNRTLQITKGVNGEPDIGEDGKETYNKYIKMMGDPEDSERPVLDFNGTVAAVVAVGNYWYFKDFDVIRCKDGEKGVQVSGSWCVFDRVDTYRNGSTGLQICRAASTDTYRDWPHDNLILNCNSYLNVDKGYEDADGFAAKLTSGSNNVFDGCIAAFNADDGWDLFAKAQTGSIGGVIIKNSIAYRNGYVLKSVKDGTIKTPAEAAAEGDSVVCVKGDGNGNGFKMGGDGLPAGSQYDEGYEERDKDPNVVIPNIGHRLYNSLSFGNKSKGIDSNSAPNIKAYNSISFNNDGSNVSLYTYDTNKNTDYELQNVVSIRTGTDPSRIEPDVKEFPAVEAENVASYKATHSINFRSDADPGNKSSAIYFSLKNARSMHAKVRVWWRNSDSNSNSQLQIMSEKAEILGTERRISEADGLIISELETKGKEKCFLGSKGGSINLYKAEIIVEVQENKQWVERTYAVDISAIDEYKQCTEPKDLTRNSFKSKIHSKPVEITLYYRAIPLDSVSHVGDQPMDNIENESVFIWNVEENKSFNKGKKNEITEKDFVSLDYPYLNTVSPENWRNEDGTIKTDGFLQLKPDAGSFPADKIPSIGGTGSADSDKLKGDEDTDGTVSSGNAGTVTPGGSTESDYGEDYPTGGLNVKDEQGNDKYFRRIWAADIKYVDYTDKEEIVYTGKAIKPEIHVRFSGNSELLNEGKDYRLKLENNVNAGEAKVTIIGKANYAGYNNEKTFTIKKISLDDETIFVPSCVAAAKDAQKEIKPTWLGKTLKAGKDYTIEQHPTDTSMVVVKGIGNFEGEKEVKVLNNVSADKLMSKASVKITTLTANLVYTQNDEVKPECEVKLGGKTLVKGTDYEVTYANNREIGKATLTVVGKNDGTNGYFGSKSINFSIKGGSLKDATMTYTISKTESMPLAEYMATKLDGAEYNGSTHQVPVNRVKVELNGKILKNGTDYTIVQKGMERAGTATVTIKGIKGYTGSQSFKFKILPFDISNKEKLPDSAFSYVYENTYKMGGVKFDKFSITINKTAVDAKNYSLAYKNNREVTLDGQTATVIVTGRNGLTGKRELPFVIKKSPMTAEKGIAISAKDIATNGNKCTYADLKKSAVTVTQLVNNKARKLSAGRDYDKAIEYYIDIDGDFKINTSVDEKVSITGESSKALLSEREDFKKNGYLTVLVRVKAASGEKCCYGEGYTDGYFRVAMNDIKRAKVIYLNGKNRVFGQEINESNGTTSAYGWDMIADINNYIALTFESKYDPNALTPEARKKAQEDGTEIVWIRKGDTEYLIRPEVLNMDGYVMVPNSYKKNARVGTATFEIRGTGKNVGTRRVSFKILSKEQSDKLASKK